MMYIIWAEKSNGHNADHGAACSYFQSQDHFASGCRGTLVFHGYFGRIVINTELAKIAIKRIPLSYDDEDSIEHEPNILMELSNKNILQCHLFGRNENYLFIATELCAGTLRDLVDGKFKEQRVIDKREILRQITGAIAYLHKERVIHRDIKPTNIFITHVNAVCDPPPQMKLADFGQSIRIKDGEQHFCNYLNDNYDPIWGTMGWRAPELSKASGQCDFKIDIFSLGLIFAYTLVDMTGNGYHPFDELTVQGIINQVKRNNINDKDDPIKLTSILGTVSLSEPYSALAIPLIESMLKRNPTERPTADQVINDNFFSSPIRND